MPEKKLILIVDDDADFRDLLNVKLTDGGFTVVEAENGTEGVKKTKEILPDLILMDVKMPTMDGVEAMTQIMNSNLSKPMKIIFLTAFGDPEPDIYKIDQRFAREVGAFDYVMKTEDLDSILAKIRNTLSS